MKLFRNVPVLLLVSFLTTSCFEMEFGDGFQMEPEFEVTLNAVAEGSRTNNAGEFLINGFSVNTFWVATKDVDMRYIPKSTNDTGKEIGIGTLNSNKSSSLYKSASKPQSLNLITQGKANVATVGKGKTVEGNYAELEFTIFKNSNAESKDPLKAKSLLIIGEFNEKFLTIHFDFDKTILARPMNPAGFSFNGPSELRMAFDLDLLFANVDFSTAQDEKENGMIELNPKSKGANEILFKKIQSNLENSVVFKKK